VSVSDATSPRPLIVVIDDDDPARDALVTALEGVGYRALGTAEAELGIELVRRERAAALVLDLYMPGMDGFEAMSALKSADNAVPVIVMSGGIPGRPGDILPLALDFGAAAILHKPFTIEALDATIRKVLGST
jgi:DNA-binding response OmpR family regulator